MAELSDPDAQFGGALDLQTGGYGCHNINAKISLNAHHCCLGSQVRSLLWVNKLIPVCT